MLCVVPLFCLVRPQASLLIIGVSARHHNEVCTGKRGECKGGVNIRADQDCAISQGTRYTPARVLSSSVPMLR